MREIGCVASVEGDAAVVAMPGTNNCGQCGICLMAQEGREFLLLARNSAGARPGDTVEVEIEAGKVVAAAFAVYMVPVIVTIGGFLVGTAITHGSPDSELPILMAVGGLVLSFGLVWVYDLKLRRSETRQAVITRILTVEEVEREKKQVRPVRFGG
jgi:sigma-E factor negative regulatory protein RseC